MLKQPKIQKRSFLFRVIVCHLLVNEMRGMGIEKADKKWRGRTGEGGRGWVSDVLFELPLTFLFLEKELKYCTITYIEKINAL